MTERPEPTPDISTILETLRAEIRARRMRYADTVDDPLMQELRRSLDDIELHRVVSAHWPLVGRTLPERAMAFINKVVRRGLRWYINPIVEQQNAYNATVAQTLRLMSEAYEELSRRIAEHDDDNDSGGGKIGGIHSAEAADSAAVPADRTAAQAWVQHRALHEPPATFPDLDVQPHMAQLRLRGEVNAHWPIEGRTVPGRITAFVQRLVRRYLRWLINPIVEQQNAANLAITGALLALIRVDAERRAREASGRIRNQSH